MERVIVLGLRGCKHCEALTESLQKVAIPFEFKDVDLKEHSNLADRMETILKTQVYPMVIMEGSPHAIYLYREDSYENAKPSPIGYAVKIGCVSTEMMVDQIKKHFKK